MLSKFPFRQFCSSFKDDPYSKIKPKDYGREFYLPENKKLLYLPKDEIQFGENAKACIYRNDKFTMKVVYLPKLVMVFLGLSFIYSSNVFMDFGLLSFIVGGGTLATAILHSIIGGRVLNRVDLHQNGLEVDFTYKILPFIKRTTTVKIADLAGKKSSPLMLMWSLNPIPKNILAFLENEARDFFPLYQPINKFQFLLLHRGNSEMNEELFINVMNGVSIDTYKIKNRVHLFKDRYIEYRIKD